MGRVDRRDDAVVAESFRRLPQQHDVAGGRRNECRRTGGLACPGDRAAAYSRGVTVFLLILVVLAALVALAATGALRVRRYSHSHVDAQLAIAGRGLHFTRTPDGVWWRLRLRPCRRVYEDRSGWGEPPPDSVREPRRPLGPNPLTAAAELDLPRD